MGFSVARFTEMGKREPLRCWTGSNKFHAFCMSKTIFDDVIHYCIHFLLNLRNKIIRMVSLNIILRGFDDDEKRQLLHIINGRLSNTVTLILLKINADTDEERLNIRSLMSKNFGATLIVFSSRIEIAQLAWDVNANGFVNMSREDWSARFISALNAKDKHRYWTVNSTQQVDLVDVSKVTYILAQGNYSVVNFCDRPRILVTKQLGRIESELAGYGDLERFGKSLILNLSQVRRIKDNCVYFDSKDVVRFSKSSKWIKILKDRLLWK